MLLAEAGTGIGKTLAYLAPASVWAEQSGGTVWVSTFTKALQRQLDAEGPKLFADAEERARRIVVRKGRENYLCLLNLEDALQGAFSGRAAVLAQLVGRWAAYTKDGDMVGGDLPGWLPSLFRRAGATALTDRRGECVYAGCPHYRRCFIERAERASREADLVIANHALVMVNAARAREDAPGRILFDEGHHLFDAADSTFAVAFGGQEAIELRRWIVGPEGRSRGRRRGLAARLMDVASYDEEGALALDAAVEAAKALPSDGWLQRLVEGSPFGPIEALLSQVRGTVYARAKAQEAGYGLETELAEPDGALVSSAAAAAELLEGLQKPLAALGRRLEAVLEDAPDWLDSQARARVEGAIRGLSWGARRSPLGLRSWRGSAAKRTRNSSTGSRLSGSTGASSTSRSIAAGSTPPSRWPAPCLLPPMECSSRPPPCAAGRAGPLPRRALERSTSPDRPPTSRRKVHSITPAARKC
jgi:ATP-dependent DNA helicase DinG